MRLPKSFGTVIALLALLAWVAAELPAQTTPPAKAEAESQRAGKAPQANKAPAPTKAAPQAQPPSKRSQAPKQAVPAPQKEKPAAKAAPAAKQQAAPAAKAAPAVKQQPSPAAKQPAKAAPKAQAAAAAPSKAKPAPAAPAEPKAVAVARRDPFDPLIGRQRPGAEPERLPPGKAGLVVGSLRLDGLVRGPNGMIAVVSNPQQRVYFLREGDQLYDGRVERITMDAVAFHESGKDAFGKPVDRQVTKRLYPSPGEQR